MSSHSTSIPAAGAAHAPGTGEALSPETVRLLALALCASGRLDVRALSVLLDLLVRESWLTGFRQALGQQPHWTPVGAPCGLTQRELAVLRLVAIGRNNDEVGRALSISRNTVATHLRSILHKTFTANRTEAAAFAYREGLLASPGPGSATAAFSAEDVPAAPPASKSAPEDPPAGASMPAG